MKSYVLDSLYVTVKDAIANAVVQAGLVNREELPAFVLEVPKDKANGDLATNAAMQLTKIAKLNPRVIAEKIIENLDMESASIEAAEIAGPGFINFRMDKSYLYNVIHEVLEGQENYGRLDNGKGQSVEVEFVSANPTGNLHLGHARGAAVGDSLCNVLNFAGYEVTREYYINDAGKQIENLALSIEARYLQELGQDASMPEDGYYGEDIIGFAKQLVAEKGEALLKLEGQEKYAFYRSYGLERELDKIKRDLERFRVGFDIWYSETSLYEEGKVTAALEQLKASGHVYEEEGATWLNTMTFGDDKNRVLVKNDGSYTYLTPDISYHLDKYSRGYDRMINIWGADHHGYIPRIKAAMDALGNDSSKLTVLIAQMVSLFQNGEKVKMSKRTGKAVTMQDLMEEVGVDAIRYNFASRSMDSHLDFDMDLAVSTSNENPVFYVQYAHARICSVLRQAEEQGVQLPSIQEVSLHVLTSEHEFDLLRKLGEFPQEVNEAAVQFAPHRIVRYVYELASAFHSYYRAEKVITDNKELTHARLALMHAVKITLVNALLLIGVSAPERM